MLQAGAKGIGFSEPGREGFRAVKGEDRTRARVGIALVAEERFDTGGFVKERERAGDSGGKKSGKIW